MVSLCSLFSPSVLCSLFSLCGSVWIEGVMGRSVGFWLGAWIEGRIEGWIELIVRGSERGLVVDQADCSWVGLN